MIYHPASERGQNDFGWLKTKHSFSFGQYYDPTKVHFGALRVLNDDIVAPGMGFSTHPHENMEIISIPLEGGLKHKDTSGSSSIIKTNDVQVMSAGTGLYHSEMNASRDDRVCFLQIWIIPREQGVLPRYDQRSFSPEEFQGRFSTLVTAGPDAKDALWIHQDAHISLGNFPEGETTYGKKFQDNGVYFFILSGAGSINGQSFHERDGIGITEDEIRISLKETSKILAIEVPMKF